MPEVERMEFAVIGAGTAGLVAGMYAGRQTLKTVVFEHKLPGGLGLLAGEVENYPGFLKISGPDLMQKLLEHAEASGAVVKSGVAVKKIEKKTDTSFIITTEGDGDKVYEAKAILITTGGDHRKLGVPGEERLAGLGVSYCAICDGFFFKKKRVIVVGGGNSAVDAAVYLADLCTEVYLSYRGDKFNRPEPVLVQRLEKSKVKVLFNTDVLAVQGTEKVSGVKLKNNKDGTEQVVEVDGVFVEIGSVPATELAKSLGCEIKGNYIHLADRDDPVTNVPGVYAAGDVTGGIKQFVTGAGDGCRAAIRAYNYIRGAEVSETWK